MSSKAMTGCLAIVGLSSAAAILTMLAGINWGIVGGIAVGALLQSAFAAVIAGATRDR